MRLRVLRLPLYLTVSLVFGAIIALGAWAGTVILGAESETVEWALRLPREQERAKKAGVYPPFPEQAVQHPDTGPNAADEYERLDAIIRVMSPDDNVPRLGTLLQFVDQDRRKPENRRDAEACLQRYRSLLPQAAHTATFRNCQFRATRPEEGFTSGVRVATFLGLLHLVEAVHCNEHHRPVDTLAHAMIAIRIGRQIEYQAAYGSFGLGYELEAVAYRVLIEGLTVPDIRSRRALAAVIRSRLIVTEDDPLPATQLLCDIRSEMVDTHNFLDTLRQRKFSPKNYPFANYSLMTRYLNRLDFYLSTRAGLDSDEAELCYDAARMAQILQPLKDEKRPYPVLQAAQWWELHRDRALPRGIYGIPWEVVMLQRMDRDVRRGQMVAILRRLADSQAPLPDDPYAPKAGVPLRERLLPDGHRVIYSIGNDGRDDGGDKKHDIVVTIPPL